MTKNLNAAEIYRTANLLIDTYGEMAPVGAFVRADQLADDGDLFGRAVWLSVARVAEDLLSSGLPDGAIVH